LLFIIKKKNMVEDPGQRTDLVSVEHIEAELEGAKRAAEAFRTAHSNRADENPLKKLLDKLNEAPGSLEPLLDEKGVLCTDAERRAADLEEAEEEADE